MGRRIKKCKESPVGSASVQAVFQKGVLGKFSLTLTCIQDSGNVWKVWSAMRPFRLFSRRDSWDKSACIIESVYIIIKYLQSPVGSAFAQAVFENIAWLEKLIQNRNIE